MKKGLTVGDKGDRKKGSLRGRRLLSRRHTAEFYDKKKKGEQ
jgi:hypothetical protein